jgi:hypothetical protein
LSPPISSFLQYLFLDTAWSLSLHDVILAASDRQWPEDLDLFHARTAEDLNSSRHDFEKNLTTFEQLLRDEIYGSAHALARALTGAYSRFTDSKHSVKYTSVPENLIRLIANATILKRDVRILHPTLFVNASYHALTRWDRARQLRGNDIYDCDHAAAALGYCHAYFGEASLCHLLKQGPLHLSDLHGCRTAATLAEARQKLEQMAAENVPRPVDRVVAAVYV